MRDAEDRLPELRILRVLVLLGLVDRTFFERAAGLLHSFEHAPVIFFAGRQLFCFFWVFFHPRLYPDESAVVVKLALLSLWPLVKRADVDDDLPFCIHCHFGAVHRARRRSFEVNALAVVATAMARAFELVLTCLPVGCTTEMSATCIDDEESIGCFRHPDAVLLLPFCIDAERVIAWRADAKRAGRFENRARQEKPHEHQEEGKQRAGDGSPDDPSSHFVHGWIGARLHSRGRSRWLGWSRCTRWRAHSRGAYTWGGQLIGLTIQVQTSVESTPNCQVLRTSVGTLRLYYEREPIQFHLQGFLSVQ